MIVHIDNQNTFKKERNNFKNTCFTGFWLCIGCLLFSGDIPPEKSILKHSFMNTLSNFSKHIYHRQEKIQVVTITGSGESGYVEGSINEALFFTPNGIAIDSSGIIYIADTYNHRIRKIELNGIVSTIAGSDKGYADGKGEEARFNFPVSVAVDHTGKIYVADYQNQKIRIIDTNGNVSTLAGSVQGYADGNSNKAKFNSPHGIAVDYYGNVFVADTDNQRIRKINLNGLVSTVAGSTKGHKDGQGIDAQFNNPFELTIGNDGVIYVADTYNHAIRKISRDGMVYTIAGNNPVDYNNAAKSEFNFPRGIDVDHQGNLFIADMFNNGIVAIDKHNKTLFTTVNTVKGFIDGNDISSAFNMPRNLAVDINGNILVADTGNHARRKLVLR